MTHAEAYDLAEQAGGLSTHPVLLVGATFDQLAPPEQHLDPLVERLGASAAPLLTYETLPADHYFSTRRIALTRLVVAWLQDTCR